MTRVYQVRLISFMQFNVRPDIHQEFTFLFFGLEPSSDEVVLQFSEGGITAAMNCITNVALFVIVIKMDCFVIQNRKTTEAALEVVVLQELISCGLDFSGFQFSCHPLLMLLKFLVFEFEHHRRVFVLELYIRNKGCGPITRRTEIPAIALSDVLGW